MASLRMLTVQAKKVERLQAELTKVELLKRDLEAARKYNINLVNQKAEEKKKTADTLSAFEVKNLDLEKANEDKATAEKNVDVLIGANKKQSEEIAVLKQENEKISAKRDEAKKSAEDAEASLEKLRGQNTKEVIRDKWFQSRQCKLRDAYLDEQMRYGLMDMVVDRIKAKYPDLNYSDIDFKMNLDDANEKSYFYQMDPVPKQISY